MKDMNILELEFSDDDIFELLRDALEDITGYDGEITLETELIDELGLENPWGLFLQISKGDYYNMLWKLFPNRQEGFVKRIGLLVKIVTFLYWSVILFLSSIFKLVI